VNVLANPNFGTVISENGVAYTWSENAHEFRLTPWHNDPVSDASGEAFYLRDEDSGQFWSPTPLPAGGVTPYVSRHGFGYSVFEHAENGIHSELWVYVAVDTPIKFSVLKVRNESGQTRRLSATGYLEWVLGDLRPKSALHLITEIDPTSGALFARNPYNTEFADRLAFFDVDDVTRTFSGDRTEFIGRNGTLRQPAAMTRAGLSGKVGAALDACAAIQVNFELAAGQEHEIVFRLGVAGRRGADDASTLVHRCRGAVGGADGARRGAAPLATHPRRGAGGNAGPSAQCAGEWLAGVSDPGLSAVGAQRLLPVGRRVWIPRSVAGFDGADPHRAGPAA
jgi:cyclic beta-1,2-glucan synthetase